MSKNVRKKASTAAKDSLDHARKKKEEGRAFDEGDRAGGTGMTKTDGFTPIEKQKDLPYQTTEEG